MSPPIPLLWRAPNPPSPFLGRDAEVERLRALLRRGTVVVVWGFSGVGKSALVQAALHDDGDPDVLSRTLWVRGDGDVLGTIASRLGTIDAPVAARPEDLADALERAGVWIVVDGVERLAAHAGLPELVTLLDRHGRRARLVCVCREDPRDPALITRTVRVDALDNDALGRLLDAVAPGLPTAGRAALVQAAGGSPWRMVQLAVDGGAAPAAPEASLLALSPISRGLLSTLAVAGGGLSTAVLQRATRLPDDDALRGLARRGWVERVGDALHLHRAAVAFVVTGVSTEERRRRRTRLVEALLVEPMGVDIARQTLQLVRAVLDDDGAGVAGPLARRLLLEAGPGLRAAGAASALWDVVVGAGLLAHSDDVALIAPLADLAVDVGDAAVALLGDPPVDTDPVRLVAVASLRSARADHDGAHALLQSLIEDTAIIDVADEARTVAVVAAVALALDRGDDDLATGLVARLPSALRPPVAALIPSASPGTPSTALVAWPTLPLAVQGHLLPALCRSLHAGWRADDVIALAPDGDDIDMGTARGRALALGRARALACGGDADSFSVLVAQRSEARVGVEARVWAFIDRERRGVVDEERERAAVRLAVDEVRAAPRLQRLAAHLGDSPVEERHRRQSADPALDRVLAHLHEEPSTLRSGARAFRQAARAGGDRLAALELAFVVADAVLAGGGDRPGEVLAFADDIEQEARAVASPRGVDEANLLRASVGRDGGRDGAQLASLAQGGHSALVRRRARLLLGDDVASPWDRSVVPANQSGAPVPSAVVDATGARSDREWTVDEARRRIVVGHDVVIDLADKGILFGLLLALGRRGGSATKEQLQEDVWGERHYHPLRHDNRLKVAVRKLRRLLEDALGDDPLEAGDDGYRLRGRVRFVS